MERPRAPVEAPEHHPLYRYTLPQRSLVTLKVYDLLGREVGTLVDGWQTVGHYSIPFDAQGLASGLYFYRLAAGKSTKTRQMFLAR